MFFFAPFAVDGVGSKKSVRRVTHSSVATAADAGALM